MAQKIARWGLEIVAGSSPLLEAPSVAALGVTGSATGRFVIVWAQGTDAAGLGDPTGIVGQLFASDGGKNGDAFLVNTTTDRWQANPVVIDRTDDQGFAVAWTDNSTAAIGIDDGNSVRMRFFDVDATPEGDDFIVNTTNSQFSNQNDPSIDRVGTFGTIFVGFDTSEIPLSIDKFSGVRGRVYSNETPLGPDFIVTTEDTHSGENGFQAQVNVTDLPETGFLATWIDNLDSGVSFGVGSAVRGRIYSHLGVPIGTEFDIAANADELMNHVAATGLADDTFVVAWTQDEDPSDGGFERNIYARIFKDGVGGTPFLIHEDTTGQQDDVAIAAYGPDKFVVAWTHQPAVSEEIRARIFNADGTAFSDEIIVNSDKDDSEALPALAVLREATGPRIVVSWRDNTTSEVRAQILDPAGGAAGIDFFGGDDGETYTVQYGETVLHGNGGDDVLTGLGGDDRLDGGDGGDTLRSGAGFDTLIGRAGDDILDGGSNPAGQGDFLFGGPGDDTYHVDSPLDFVDEGNFPAFAVFGFGGTDTIISTADFFWDLYSVGEVLRVSPAVVDAGGDGVTIVHSVFSGELVGHSGTDIQFGRGGSDTYRPGGGVDFMSFSTLGVPDAPGYVANGVNTLVMEVGNSYDIVFEFEVGRDKINLEAFDLASTADLFARGFDDGAGSSYFVLGDGFDYLYMVGLELSELQAADFVV